MKVIPFIHEGLGNSSYLVQISERSAILVDPDRNVNRYLREADARGLGIVDVLETHVHADFVTGSRELLDLIGIEPHASRGGHLGFPHRGVSAGDAFVLEGVRIRIIGSPGHTPEHLSYALQEPRSETPLLFSGGSLIVGGAARTDLISPDLTDTLTRAQYQTLQHAFADMPDDTLLYPTHGGGSFCSAGVGGERTSTLGRERASNPLLAFADEDEFSDWFPTTFPSVPDYFFKMRPLNQAGPRLRSDIADPPALRASEFSDTLASGVVIDTRHIDEYMAGHIGGAISIAFRPAYSTWLGWLVPLGTPLKFVIGNEPLEDVLSESLLVGQENFAGRLKGGMESWTRAGLPVQRTRSVAPDDARQLFKDGAVALDVRERGEFEAGHVQEAIHMPLGDLSESVGSLPATTPIVTYCGHGERAITGISLLERSGVEAWNLDGGFDAWR
ncbi:MAG TPA: rhodanese-like domain-containing protein [Dehalococcoidia bacterium]|nr:rhodanese-like domain-containing protein [Dehalococcoidia bacterium]